MTNPTEAPMANAIDDVKATHRHVKRGTKYVLIGIGKMQAEHWWTSDKYPERVDMTEVAIYRSATDPTEIWVRPREEFEDGRFEVLLASPAPSQHTGWSDEAVEVKALVDDCHRLLDNCMYEEVDVQANLEAIMVNVHALAAASSIAPATGFEVAAQRLKAAYIAETGSTMWPTDEQFRRILAASSISPSVAKESGEP